MVYSRKLVAVSMHALCIRAQPVQALPESSAGWLPVSHVPSQQHHYHQKMMVYQVCEDKLLGAAEDCLIGVGQDDDECTVGAPTGKAPGEMMV